MINSTEAMGKALKNILMAIEGVRHRAVAIGAVAGRAWGATRDAESIKLLVSSREEQRNILFSAARGEGFQHSPDLPLRLTYTDAKLGETVSIDLMEPSTDFHSQIISRATMGRVLGVQMPLATCEDLIILEADSHAVIVELLRAQSSKLDAEYLKREADAAGVFDKIKTAWQEARS